MFVAAYAVIDGNMTIGDWFAVQTWVSSVFAPLVWLGAVYSSVLSCTVDIQGLVELLEETADVVDAPNATVLKTTTTTSTSVSSSEISSSQNDDNVDENDRQAMETTSLLNHSSQITAALTLRGLSIEFRELSFHYAEQEAEHGLKQISFMIPPGSTTAIVGATGSGKTTISRLLFRFFDPQQGTILINGQDIKLVTQQSLRQAIGIVPQDTVLFNDTIRQNIQYGRMNANEDELKAAAAAAQIEDFIEHTLPQKWETIVGERGLKLSGGEKQRVAIARCLLKNPPIVVLDEVSMQLYFL
jgi:ATP-binding cassette, subfamily B, heavy metal transporter